MKLYERFADESYHTSTATTIGIDFDAYESIVLPRLRGAGCRNNIVIPGSRMLTHALNGASTLPQQAGHSGGTAGQTIGHAHVHLIPRRQGDVQEPKRRCEVTLLSPHDLAVS